MIALILLGLGWSAATVAGAALLTEASAPELRTRRQGRSDSLMSLCAAAGAVLAGVVLSNFQYSGLGVAAAVLVVAIVAGGVILNFALGSSTATAVAVTPQTEPLAQPLGAIARANDEEVRIVRVDDDAAARTAVADEVADAARGFVALHAELVGIGQQAPKETARQPVPRVGP